MKKTLYLLFTLLLFASNNSNAAAAQEAPTVYMVSIMSYMDRKSFNIEAPEHVSGDELADIIRQAIRDEFGKNPDGYKLTPMIRGRRFLGSDRTDEKLSTLAYIPLLIKQDGKQISIDDMPDL